MAVVTLGDHPGAGAALEMGERLKLLELAHRGRSFGALPAVLSLGMLRRSWSRLWTAPVASPAQSTPRPASGIIALTLVGHATVMLTTRSTRVLVDPLLGDWLGGLRRARGAVLADCDLSDVELALVSSTDRDRLAVASLRRLPRTATLVVPRGCGPRIHRHGLGLARVVELAVGETFRYADLEITATPVSGPPTHGRWLQSSGHLIRGEGHTLYFAGPTGYFSGFRELAAGQQAKVAAKVAPRIDVAVLPVAGYQPAARRREHMSPLDALFAFEDLRAARLVPVGFGSFDVGYEPIDEPEEWLRALVRERGWQGVVTILHNGQTITLD
jgi:L-ascorbate metabolism protein UlaG (beta-lactamase superfamily)